MKLSNLIEDTIKIDIEECLPDYLTDSDLLFKDYRLSLVYEYLKDGHDFEFDTNDQTICNMVWLKHKSELISITDNDQFCQKYIEFFKDDYVLTEQDIERLIQSIQNKIESTYGQMSVTELSLDQLSYISILKSVYEWLSQNKSTFQLSELKILIKTKNDCDHFVETLNQVITSYLHWVKDQSVRTILNKCIEERQAENRTSTYFEN